MDRSEQYYELTFYTLAHPDNKSFIHQHIVDAEMAQTANTNTKPISIVFALVGLYLVVEKKYTGRQVQQIHTQLAKNKKEFPKIILPEKRGEITISEVLEATAGPARDQMIQKWCTSVWDAYKESHKSIIEYFSKNEELYKR